MEVKLGGISTDPCFCFLYYQCLGFERVYGEAPHKTPCVEFIYSSLEQTIDVLDSVGTGKES